MENLVTVPEHWDESSTQNLARYVLDPVSDEYQAIATNFHKTLPTSKINQIERIQNRRKSFSFTLITIKSVLFFLK